MNLGKNKLAFRGEKKTDFIGSFCSAPLHIRYQECVQRLYTGCPVCFLGVHFVQQTFGRDCLAD